MFAVFVLLLIAAIICTIASAIGKLPVWIAVAISLPNRVTSYDGDCRALKM